MCEMVGFFVLRRGILQHPPGFLVLYSLGPKLIGQKKHKNFQEGQLISILELREVENSPPDYTAGVWQGLL